MIHPKTLRVQELNEAVGEESAKVIIQMEDAARLESWEAFFRQEVIGRKSSYQEDVQSD